MVERTKCVINDRYAIPGAFDKKVPNSSLIYMSPGTFFHCAIFVVVAFHVIIQYDVVHIYHKNLWISGYVGCSYIQNQIYSSATNQVLDTFSAEVKRSDILFLYSQESIFIFDLSLLHIIFQSFFSNFSLDLTAALSIPTANEAVHVTVNNVKTELVSWLITIQ